MQAQSEFAALKDLIQWIDDHTAGLSLPADERSQLAVGCFDVALEHQAAMVLLHHSGLYGSALALLRVLSESVVRGLWLHDCATDVELDLIFVGRAIGRFRGGRHL